MQLVCSAPYRLTVMTNRRTGHTITVDATFAGGGCVDDKGHHIGGGTWVLGRHPHYRYFTNLHIVHIEELRTPTRITRDNKRFREVWLGVQSWKHLRRAMNGYNV